MTQLTQPMLITIYDSDEGKTLIHALRSRQGWHVCLWDDGV
ncbi:MAG: hypothetical protein U1E92_04850 [Moraxella osloensis]